MSRMPGVGEAALAEQPRGGAQDGVALAVAPAGARVTGAVCKRAFDFRTTVHIIARPAGLPQDAPADARSRLLFASSERNLAREVVRSSRS